MAKQDLLNKYRGKWTKEAILTEASLYSSREQFKKKSNTAYKRARKIGIYDEVCNIIPSLNTKWTYELIHSEALKYNTRYEFQKSNGKAYKAAQEFKIIDSVCSHMEIVKKKWDLLSATEAASKYNKRVDFQKSSDQSAYNWAWANGLLDVVCESISPTTIGFDASEPMTMYYIKIHTFNKSIPDVWKIGITKNNVSTRFYNDHSAAETKIDIINTWSFNTGQHALDAEQNIKNVYKEYKYCGKSPLRNTGNTEMFYCDILKQKGNDNG